MKKEAVDAIVTGLKQAGINFVSMLPDSDFTDTQKTVMTDKTLTCVPVSNEAIGFGVCAGAWLGGKKPALLITTDRCRGRRDGRTNIGLSDTWNGRRTFASSIHTHGAEERLYTLVLA
jgi:sulfopyruvate decarboxylase subunit alpha